MRHAPRLHVPIGLRPEHTLLAAATRTHIDLECRTRLRELAAADLDWKFFVSSASRHGVAPLVFHALTASGAIHHDDPRAAVLWKHFAANAGNSLVLAHQLLEVLGLLTREGIPAIAYKGPVLGASLYGNLALREFTDLDVLVHSTDVAKAGELLVSHGFEPELKLTPSDERALLRTRAGYFRRFDRSLPSGRVALELHWRIPATFDLDRGLWQRVTPERLLDHDALHFALEDLVLILCAHGFKHGWSQLKWVCDVAELIARYPALDWNVAIGRASSAGGLRILLLGCALARLVLDTELPTLIAERIDADPVVLKLSERFRDRLFDDGRSHRVGIACNLRVRERMWDRLRYGLALLDALTIPTMKDRLEWRVQRSAPLMARVRHPFRIVRRLASKHQA